MPELVDMAGGSDALSPSDPVGEHSAWIAWERVVESRPDIVVCQPCGFNLTRAVAESEHLRELPEWETLPAVQAGRVYAVDGNRFFNRPGPRLVDSLRILGEMFHPEALEPKHEDDAWTRL